MKNIFLILLIMLLPALKCQGNEIAMRGQVSAWAIYNDDYQTGIRYIPELRVSNMIKGIDGEISVNTYANEANTNLKYYRLWFRYTSSQFELRGGLQKINFGQAKILRSLMWFDQIDVRDPLELTNGVYGLLGRYYFLNNTNIWIWGLYGNEELKGLEVYKSDKDKIEIGLRCQFPIFGGETALSCHQRHIDKNYWNNIGITQLKEGIESRYGCDGIWDIGIGLWYETAVSEIKIDNKESLWQESLTIGMDYTFYIGPGIHFLYEQYLGSSGSKIDKQINNSNISAASVDFSVSLLDSINCIGYYDWKEEKTYVFTGLQRTYDSWLINFNLFSSSKSEDSIYSGNGIQLMVTYNH